MRDSERLLDQARQCFAEAAKCDDAIGMRILAERGAEYLAQAQEAAAREKKSENGHR
jgi:hypothetical protein